MAKKNSKKPPVKIGEVYEQQCSHCAGNGQEPGLRDLTCRVCMGRGRQKWRIITCPECQGKGKKGFLSWGKCRQCQGNGWTTHDVG
jgi:DnaJ-class molecular chaperone